METVTDPSATTPEQQYNPQTGQPINQPQQDGTTSQVSTTKDAAGNFVFPEITVSGSPDLVLPDINVTGTSDAANIDTSATKQNKTQQGGVQLISPTIVPSTDSGGSPQVLSSVLGAPSSTILGQALQSSNPDPSTTGSPILDGDGKNVRNVWNTESLRTALGL
jgi:hypothetical protein